MAQKAKGKKRGIFKFLNFEAMDMPMLAITIIILMFGLVMLYSASYAYAYYYNGDSYYYINSQIRYAILGVVAMFAASFIDYHVWKKFAWALMFVTLGLMVVVLFMPAGPMNAHRWIWLNSSRTSSFQPSEIAKFALILLFANLISIHEKRMKTFTYGFLPFGVVLVLIGGLLFLQPHLSCMILILGIGVCMMFSGGSSIKWFGMAGVAGVVLLALIFIFPDLLPHAYERLDGWVGGQSGESELLYQTEQSLIAIGSGGLTGRGIGNSRQKFLYLPEMYNDYIFAVICEELGFIGAMIVVLLFLVFLARGMYIAFRAKDKFGSMLAIGISVQIALQAFLHMAVNTNLIPSTGIALPFFSYGGTSLCMLLGQMGILLSVSRQAKLSLRREQEEDEAPPAAKEPPKGVRASL